jgi:hypothetical protein
MSIERFVGTPETLAGSGWTKPQHVVEAIAERRRRKKWRQEQNKRAFCPTGDGGGVDNSCSPSQSGSSSGDQSQSSGSSPSAPSSGPASSPRPRAAAVSRQDISKLLQKIGQNPDGFTLDPLSTEQPSDGIMVSEFVNDSRRSIKIKANEIETTQAAEIFSAWYSDNSDLLLGDDTRFVGGWKTGDDFYIDVATRFKPGEAAAALEAGRKAGQLAVFNLATFKETWVQYESGDQRKPKEWDAGFARARKDMSVKQVYDESSPAMQDEDWADELTKHGKSTVRFYNPDKETPDGKHKRQGRAVRRSDEADDHRRVPGVSRVRGEGSGGERRDARSGMVRGQSGAEAAPLQGSAAPSAAEGRGVAATSTSRRFVADAVEFLEGQELPVEFRDLGKAIAYYSSDDDTIYVSPNISPEAASSLESSTKSGWFSQPNPVLHEYSHRYHYLCDQSGYAASCEKPLSDEQRSLIAAEVSGYAATDAAEFVAEYIAGRLSGHTYSAGVSKILDYVTDGAVRL